jgi:RbsD / FucU transport protein family
MRFTLGILAMLIASATAQAQTAWQQKVQEELPLMGHRNWIVVVDSAYPLQTSPGIETIETNADHLAVMDFVLQSLKTSLHVRPIVHLDRELDFLPDAEAPGVNHYKDELKKHLHGLATDSALHEKLIEQLNETGKTFHILVLKTTMTIPYTSVFLQLDCQYWSAESEAKLRALMQSAK